MDADSIALAVDLTARNVQDAVKAKGLPWSTAKGFDTFCPVGYVHILFPLPHHPRHSSAGTAPQQSRLIAKLASALGLSDLGLLTLLTNANNAL